MKTIYLITTLIVSTLGALAQGTAFTYQGRLNDTNGAATGKYDLKLTLFSAVTAGAQQGAAKTNSAVGVTNGLFTTTVDFGLSPFTPPTIALWMEIGVRTNGSGAFTTLSPRQQLTPAPFANYAAIAGTADSATTAGSASVADSATTATTATTAYNATNTTANSVNSASIVDGSIVNADINASAAIADTKLATIATAGKVANSATTATSANTANAIVARDASGNFSAGTVTASTFSGAHTGNGSSLTSLNAGNLASGTVADARLSANVALRSGGNTFGGRQIMTSTNNNGYGNAVAYIANASTDAVNASSALRLEAAGNILDGVLSVSSTTGIGYIARFGNGNGYVFDITTNGTVQASGPIQANGGLIIENRTSDPVNPQTGQIWLRTDL